MPDRRALLATAVVALTIPLMALAGCAGKSTSSGSEPASADAAASASEYLLPSQDVTPTGPASLPADWPSSLPVPPSGSLVEAEADAGLWSATWTTTGTVDDTLSAYDALLTNAGFVAGQPTRDSGSVSLDYTGNGMSLFVIVSEDAGVTAVGLQATSG